MATVQSGSATIYYEVQGTGPALLFAHGRGGNAASWWQQVPHFSQRFRVIVFDHRTFGRSRGGGEAFTQLQLAADIVAILDAEGIENAALVGQSMGGWSCLGAALGHPRRVSCLVMTSTPGGLLSQEMEGKMSEVRSRPDPTDKPLSWRALAPEFPRRRPDMAALYDQIRAFNTEFDVSNMGTLLHADNGIRPVQLEGYDIPTLFVIGGRDQSFPPEVLRMAAAMVPGAEVEEMPDSGHSPYWEEPERYNETVEGFLDKCLGRERTAESPRK